MGPKNKNIKQGDKAYIFIPFGLSRRASHLSVFVCQNWMKNGQVLTMRSARQSGAGLFWDIRWPFWPHFLRYDLQIVLPIIWINIYGQTDLQLNCI